VSQTVKQIVKDIPFLYDLVTSFRIRHWERQGRPIPPPAFIKQLCVREYGRRFSLSTLIETGTAGGYMISATKNTFARIISIELDPTLYQLAKERFSGFDHIQILQGSSQHVLPGVIASIERPCLFWLDAHYSGPGTAKGNLDTPIMDELQCILNHPVKDHVILIDDARCFVGQNDYPPIREVRDLIAGYRGQAWAFLVKDDIIRIHKPIT
jgi:hypothetical protein